MSTLYIAMLLWAIWTSACSLAIGIWFGWRHMHGLPFYSTIIFVLVANLVIGWGLWSALQ